jgi:hypothetical protein
MVIRRRVFVLLRMASSVSLLCSPLICGSGCAAVGPGGNADGGSNLCRSVGLGGEPKGGCHPVM